MKFRWLWFFTYFFNGLSGLSLALTPLSVLLLLPTSLGLWIVHPRWLWTAMAIVFCLPLLFGTLYSLTQITGAFCAHCLHQNISVHAAFEQDGICFTKGISPQPAFIAWRDIALMRRVYARYFPNDEARFRDEASYQIVLKSSAVYFVDILDSTTLTMDEIAQRVTVEGLEERLMAADFEVNNEARLKVL